MSEIDPNLTPEEQKQEQREPYTPASFEKRTAAWMGIVYVLMLLFIISFALFSGGKNLMGTFPLFVVPVAVAAIVVAIHRQYKGTVDGGLPLTIFIILLCLAAIVLGLMLGIPALIASLQGAAP